MTGITGHLPIEPQSPGPRRPHLVGQRHPRDRAWTAEQGMNLMSSTLLTEDTGVPFDQLQAEQIQLYREAWAQAGWERTPRVSVSRSIIPIVTDEDRALLRRHASAATPRTRSATSTAASPGSARATSASPTRSPRSSPRTPPSPRPTPCSSPCRTSSASTTTRACSPRSPSTWRPRSGGSRRAELTRRQPPGPAAGPAASARDAVTRRGEARTRRPA